MTLARQGLTILVALLLAAGYALSQQAWFAGTAADYAKAVDRPLVQFSALALLALALLLALVPDRTEEDGA